MEDDEEIWPPREQSPTLEDIKNQRIEQNKYLKEYVFPFCNDVNSKFSNLTKIGEGTYGEVFRAQDRSDPNRIVALKKIKNWNHQTGFPVVTLREIKCLQVLKHDNIVHLLEICEQKNYSTYQGTTNIFMVFEFCEHDLSGILTKSNVKFSLSHIKLMFKQILNGIHYLHVNNILHRDMKSENVLVTQSGTLKIADFGLARAFSQREDGVENRFSNCVVTTWYRPPELLLGDTNYGTAVDMWSVGCIMAQFWTRLPILRGTSDLMQLKLISRLCGSITPDVWPNVIHLPVYNAIDLKTITNTRKVREWFTWLTQNTLASDLLDKLLTLNPEKRIDANDALDHQFFWTSPMPSKSSDLSIILSALKTHKYGSSKKELPLAALNQDPSTLDYNF